MTEPRSNESLVTGERVSVEWPEEINEIELSFRESVDRHTLATAVRERRLGGVRPPLVALSDASTPLIARLSSEGSNPVSVFLSITPGAVDSLEQWSLPSLVEALGVDRGDVEVTSYQFLPSGEWESQLPLPLALPTMVGDTGSPQVTGFEFTFRDKAFPTRTIMLSRNDEGFLCFVTQVLPLGDPTTLLQRCIEAAAKGRGLVVQSHGEG